MMQDFKHGILRELPAGRALGIRVAVVNLFFTQDGEKQTDAALLLMRRSFGVGRMNVTLMRRNAYQITDPVALQSLANEAAQHLFVGSASVHDVNKITDIVLDSLDDLVMHPPEDAMLLRKQEEERMSRLGLLIKDGDKIIVDAR